ncbi:hypothetical protein [Nonomuraea sp. NPDC049400]|uniref:hypothetical protein n=1 Tax=Nonomuraea sp. NPDC049400 TaxID=3364352 RepID=UPI0037B6A407
MGGLLDSAGGLLERRQLTTTWFPVVIFFAAIGVVLATAAGWSAVLRTWEGLPADARVLAGVLFVAVTVAAAQLLAAARPELIRLYEGYWERLPFGTRLADALSARRDDPATRASRPWTLPTPDRLMPTRFGNVLRAAEQEAQRYGLDAATVWPRLHAVLPENFAATLGAATAGVELTITISVLGAAFALAGGTAAALTLSWYAALLCVWAGLLIAWLGHRALLRHATVYGELVRTAFDVHRWLLLDAMGLRRPTDYRTELLQWRQIQQIWQRGRPDAGQLAWLGYPDVDFPEKAENPTAEPPAAAPAKSGGKGRPAVAVLVVAGLAIALLAGVLGPEEVRTARDLPAYHPIAPGDLRPPRQDLLGRYTLAPVAKNATLTAAALGPALPAGSLAGRVITPVPVRPGLAVSPGERITLIAVPSTGAPVTADGVLVLAVQGSATLVVALPGPDLQSLLATSAAAFHPVRASG